MNPLKARTRLLAAVAGAALMMPVFAQDDEVRFTPNFQEETDILQVIEVVAEVTGRRIIPDPRVRGLQVRLYNSDPMTADEIWELFQEILQSQQLTAIGAPSGTWRIVPEQNIRTEASPIGSGSGAEIVTRYISIENVSAATMVPVLRPMMSTAAQLGAVPSTNTLILVDRADNLERIVQIIEGIDQFNAQDIDVVTLQYAAAEDVAQRLLALVQARSASGALAGLQVIPDERTNRVVLMGTPSQLATYRTIAEELDRPSTQGGGSQVRYLNYADAEEMATSLQAQFGGAQVAEDAETAADPTGGNVTVWADISTNSLVMAAPSSVMRDMIAIVDALDIPRAQVHVQAIIVEMSDDRAAELGLTWLVDGVGGDSAAILTNFSNVGGILNLAQIGVGGTPDPSVISTGVTAAVGDLDDVGTSWAAVLQAFAGDASTNILSRPELVVLDNAEAEINVGQEVPFLTGQYTSTGAAQGALNPFQTSQREPVGTILRITPRINEGTGMRLSIEQETSSIASTTSSGDFITNKRTIATEVFVDDGDILVLGGLIDDQLRESEQRVPGLGRIPGLRWLFRARNTDRTKSNLMVFIRPTILRNSDDAFEMSGEKYRSLRDQQRERAEEPVSLIKDADRPVLPPIDDRSDANDTAVVE
jgi:general secretion pathway protein D